MKSRADTQTSHTGEASHTGDELRSRPSVSDAKRAVVDRTASQIRFFREFLSQPQHVGAVAPSSQELARAMVADHDLTHADVVVELGPGTGSMTEYFARSVGPSTRFIAIERNGTFARHLSQRFPNVEVIHGEAQETPAILARLGLDGADHVLSGIPWASIPAAEQHAALDAVIEALRPKAHFATFAYTAALWLPKARRFRKLLADKFSDVDMSRTVWRNLPPALSYHCQK